MNARVRVLLNRLLRPGSPTRAAISAAFDAVVMPLGSGPPPGLKRGGVAVPADAPAVLLVLLGADDAAAQAAADGAARAQLVTPFTPVFVVDSPVLPVLRRAGYAVELLPADGSLVPARLAEHRRTYGTDAVYVVAGRVDPAVVAGLVAPVHRPLPVPHRFQRFLRRFERWYDAPSDKASA